MLPCNGQRVEGVVRAVELGAVAVEEEHLAGLGVAVHHGVAAEVPLAVDLAQDAQGLGDALQLVVWCASRIEREGKRLLVALEHLLQEIVAVGTHKGRQIETTPCLLLVQNNL